MANVFKPIGDFAQRQTDLYESISLSSSVILGYSNNNWKTYSHGMFTTVYDYPYLSSSANQLFDVTVANRDGSAYGPTSSAQYMDQKHNLYTQYEQMLFGYNASGSLIPINASGSLSPTSGQYIENPIFINFSRLLNKDEIKKGTFTIAVDRTGSYTSVLTSATPHLTLSDYTATGSNPTFYTNSPAGEYGILYKLPAGGGSFIGQERGLIFYQAGVVVLDGNKLFDTSYDGGTMNFTSASSGYRTYRESIVSSSIDQLASGSIRRISSIAYNNTTRLNSTVYFCRMNFNDFNYSSNPSYLSSSQIIVKNNNASNPPLTYITTVGLYSPANELLAVAKLSQPIKKDPSQELTLRVRLDY